MNSLFEKIAETRHNEINRNKNFYSDLGMREIYRVWNRAEELDELLHTGLYRIEERHGQLHLIREFKTGKRAQRGEYFHYNIEKYIAWGEP